MKEKLQNISVDLLKPYEKNAKYHTADQVRKLANSIKKFGFKQPLVVDKDMVVVVGHGRLEAAKSIGMTEVPCIVADDLTEDEVKAFRLADNKLNESEWLDGLLELELSDIDLDMSEFGFDADIEEEQKKQEQKKVFESMQLRAFEHYDYLVFVFKNQMDFLNAAQMFDVKKVDAGYGKTKKVGIGRVLDGKGLLEKMGYTSADTESGAEQ